MDKFKFERFVPITKVDEEERMVYGYASTPDLDSDGEVIKSEAMAEALPAYMKFPTIREMHQSKAVGKTKNAEVDKKGLYIGAKVVADDAWKLVKEGVYSAFSIGGNVTKRIGNVIHGIDLIEISLVDVPANKNAVIEVWKRGKIKKNAEGVYMLTNLMIQCKDMISYYEHTGKKTKQLTKVLEMLKSLIVTEAQEKEGEDGHSMMYAQTISNLKGMDLGENKVANSIREEVIKVMEKNLEETVKKEDEVKDEEETTETVETTETAEETTTDETTEEDAEDDASDEKETMKKIAEADKVLEKMNKDSEVKLDLTKTVNNIAGTIAKMASTMQKMEERIAELESQPAATKSKSVLVHKTIMAGGDGEAEETKTPDSSQVKAKKERLEELTKIFDEIGANSFAKQGFSKEASRLKDEIRALEATQAH